MAEEKTLSGKQMNYSNVDFNYNGLVLYDVGIKVDNEVYIKPKKLLQFLGKDLQTGDNPEQLVINERPEAVVASSSSSVLKKDKDETIGQALSKHFRAAKWYADEKEEGVIHFEGIGRNNIDYSFEFLLDANQEMTVRKVYENGIALSDEERDKLLAAIFLK